MSNEEQDLYTPSEAIKYLEESRGLIFTVDGLKSRRRRNKAKARRTLINNTLWTKAELDAIEPSRRTKLVPVKKNENGGEGGSFSSVMLIENRAQPQLLAGAA